MKKYFKEKPEPEHDKTAEKNAPTKMAINLLSIHSKK